MTRYLLRRTGLLILTGSAALVAIFVLLRLLPGDPANALLSGTATPEQIEAARRQVGSDLPWWSQFGEWASALLRGDLGTSFTSGLSVNDQIASRMAVTLPLTLAAFGISLILAIVLGYVAARARRSWAGTVISALAQLGIAVPVFWIGMLLVLVFAVNLHWLPASGFPARGWTNGATLDGISVALGFPRARVDERRAGGARPRPADSDDRPGIHGLVDALHA